MEHIEEKWELTVEEQKCVDAYLEEKGLPLNINITFGNIALPERFSFVRSRSEIQDFTTQLAPDLKLATPLISANMECVTGARLAIALQREGGLGIIPQGLPIEKRVAMLEKIGRAESALVKKPIVIEPHKTLKEAKEVMNQFGIYSLVVVDEEKKPIGILSRRDWMYEEDEMKIIRSLMGGGRKKKLQTAPFGIAFDDARRILRRHRIEKLPLVGKNGRLMGLMTAHGLFYKRHHPRATRDHDGRFLRVGSIGVGREFTKERLKEVELQVEEGICALLIDTARASSINAAEAVVGVQKAFPKLLLIVGNVSTPNGAKCLFELGADVVKVGIGPGEVCRTRAVGVGIPQASAIAKCKAIAKRYGKTIIGDGGMKNPGDVARALIVGADAVMSGYLFIGTEESEAEPKLNEQEYRVKIYEGSASREAQQKRIQWQNLDRERRPEGVAKEVPFTGTVTEKVQDILGGLRSGFSYWNVRSVQEIDEKKVRCELQTAEGLFEGIKQ